MRAEALGLLLPLAGCLAAPVSADDNTPAPQAAAEASTHSLFSLHTLDGFIDLRSEFEYTRVHNSGYGRLFAPDRTQVNKELEFQESAGVRLGGWAFDPKTLSFDGEFAFGFSQDRFHERIDDQSHTDEDHGDLLRYDLRANLFTDKKLSGSVYALRSDDRIPRQFQPTLDQRRTGAGTNWVLSDERFPMELSYDFLNTKRDGNVDERDDEDTTDHTFRYHADANFSDDHRLRFTFENSNLRQDFQGTNQTYETRRNFAELDHELQFGPQRHSELRTVLQWQDEDGDFARDFFRLGPRLTLEHSDSLQTYYEYQFSKENYDAYDIRTNRVDAGFVHHVYSNLTTTADLFALREDVEQDVDTRQQGGSVDWQYNRGNRWGRLYANFSFAYDVQDLSGGGGKLVVLDEAVTFHDPVDVTLRNRNVIEGTIVVTDTTNRRVFQRGIDYTVTTLQDTTHISRIITGRITDGQSVFVDYTYRTPGDGEIDTLRTDFSLEQRFTNGLTPYYRFSFRDEHRDDPSFYFQDADRTDHHRLGVNFDRGPWSLGAEYEIFDDSIEPYDGYHLRGRIDLLREPDQSVATSGRFSRLFFEGEDARNVNLLDLDVSWRRRFSRALSGTTRVAYRWEDDSSAGITRGWDATAGLEWEWGDLTGELTLEYDRLDLPQSVEEDYGAFVQFRRSFPNLLGRGTN